MYRKVPLFMDIIAGRIPKIRGGYLVGNQVASALPMEETALHITAVTRSKGRSADGFTKGIITTRLVDSVRNHFRQSPV